MTAEVGAPELDRSALREFGIVTGATVAALFGLFFPWLLHRHWPVWPWAIATPLWALALIHPQWLRTIYKTWMRFGLFTSRITTPIILGIVFFVVFSPMAVWRRALGKDSLERSFDRARASYRIRSRRNPVDRLERPF
jgi:hypothetical protein